MLVVSFRDPASRPSTGRVRILLTGAATGLIFGAGVALRVIDAGNALDLAANRQWFALAESVSSPLRVWLLRGLLMGLSVAVVLAFMGRYELLRKRPQRTIWQILLLALVGLPVLTVGANVAPLLRPQPDSRRSGQSGHKVHGK